jgi:hypothetical protein
MVFVRKTFVNKKIQKFFLVVQFFVLSPLPVSPGETLRGYASAGVMSKPP